MAVNGVYVVLGEQSALVALLKKARRHWAAAHNPAALEDTDPLLRNLADLKEVLNEVADVRDMNPLTFLSPFLDVIKSQNTNGPITEAALSSVARFLSYGLIDSNRVKAAHAVESIAQAVTHTKFIGGANAGSDECVLFKILQVLRCLLLSPAGRLLSNEAVCDMMQSCFRICFEMHLSEMLRKAAEATLSDMTQLIFTRLPTFEEDIRHPYIRKLVMNAKGEKRRRRRKRKSLAKERMDGDSVDEDEVEVVETDSLLNSNQETRPSEVTLQVGTSTEHAEAEQTSVVDVNADRMGYDVVLTTGDQVDCVTQCDTTPKPVGETTPEGDSSCEEDSIPIVTSLQREVRAPEVDGDTQPQSTLQMPYGLPCARELLRFLIALTNPLDRANTEPMIVLGLNLLIVALEAAADHLAQYPFLIPLLKDDLCRSLLQLLDTEKLPILAATSRACFLLFESMRNQLKFQLEAYFSKLRAIVVSEQSTVSYEKKEMALESIVQLWRIPGLVTELYLNYDCDLYCSNVFEDLTKLLVENAFPVQGLMSTSLLSLDALLVVIDNIEQNCVYRQAGAMPPSGIDARSLQPLNLPILSGFDCGKMQNDNTDLVSEPSVTSVLPRSNRHVEQTDSMPTMSDVIERKKRKRIIAEGTDLFNNSPKKGIEFLREKGLLGSDAHSVVDWLRSNPRLDKKKIADYICSRKHADVLQEFVKSFPFENTRLDDALRLFLETFRLPGEAAEISMVMQHFSEHWYTVNNEPFNHVDAAFTLSYAIIMLNTDQHNPQVRRNQPPMTVDCFKRNLSGTNGGQDFDTDMMEAMYAAIKNEEIVMPAEQTGLVKENYMWKVLLRRGETDEAHFTYAPTGWNDHDLFAISWGPAIAALSYVFDKSEHDIILQKALNGYRKCASIAAHYGMSDVFDNLIIHLCKFSTLMTSTEGAVDDNLEMQRQRSLNEQLLAHSPEAIAFAFGEQPKAHMAARAVFELVHANGDILREGWKNMLDCLLHLFRARLLPSELTEVEDFVDPKGWVSIQRHTQKQLQPVRSDAGILSWFGLGGGTNDTHSLKRPTHEQENTIKIAASVISDCRPNQLISDSKYLTSSALSELLNAITQASTSIVAHTDLNKQKTKALSTADEDSLIFYLELIISISLENKDRLSMVWPVVRRHVEWLLSKRFGKNPLLVERAVVGLLRVANRNLFRDTEQTAQDMLKALALLLTLPPQAMFILSRQISFGLHELIRNNAANVHKKEHWAILFSLLESAGAAVYPDYIGHEDFTHERNAHSDGEQLQSERTASDARGYTSEDTERKGTKYASSETLASDAGSDSVGGVNLPGRSQEWIHLDHKDAARATEDALRSVLGGTSKTSYSRGSLVLRTNMGRHEPAAFLKVGETLAFLLRDAAHVTPDNFESCVQCLRTFVEASLDGGRYAAGPLSGDAQNKLHSSVAREKQKSHKQHHKGKELSTEVDGDNGEEARAEEKQLSASYLQMSLQLLDLCHTLHVRAPGIYSSWAGEGVVDGSTHAVWNVVWRPLLQSMARLCCDCRRQIRAQALNYLVRAFLITDLQSLGAAEWDSCFGEVLFPLLGKLLEPFSPMDPIGMEETRVRAIQLVAKTLLNHLSALASLHSFTSLWLRLLDYMEKYLRVERSELLSEAVPESLKNTLLVLGNTGMFVSLPGLYQITVDRMGNVLPELIKETMPNPPPVVQQHSIPSTTSLAASTISQRVLIAPAQPPTSLPTSDFVNSQAQDLTNSSSYSSPQLADMNYTVEPSVSQTASFAVPDIPLSEVVVSGPTSPATSSPRDTYFGSNELSENVVEPVASLSISDQTIPHSASSQSAYSQSQEQIAAQEAYRQQYEAWQAHQIMLQQRAQNTLQVHAHQIHPQETHVDTPTQSIPAYQQQAAVIHDVQSSSSAQNFNAHSQMQSPLQHGAHIIPQESIDNRPSHSGAQPSYAQPSYPGYENYQQQHPHSYANSAYSHYVGVVDPATALAAHPLQGVPGIGIPQGPQPGYSVANPLPIPGYQHPHMQNQMYLPATQLATSPNSAFTYVHDPNRQQPPAPGVHQSPYFQPINSPSNQPQQ